MIIIVAGCGRSGSTMAKAVLSGAPEIKRIPSVNKEIFRGKIPQENSISKIFEKLHEIIVYFNYE